MALVAPKPVSADADERTRRAYPRVAAAKGPGIILVFAPIDRMVRISLRIDTLEVPAQDVVSHDNMTVKVNAVIFFRVIDPQLAVLDVSNFLYATSQLAQTTLRSVLGEAELDELLGQRDKLNSESSRSLIGRRPPGESKSFWWK